MKPGDVKHQLNELGSNNYLAMNLIIMQGNSGDFRKGVTVGAKSGRGGVWCRKLAR